MNPHIPVASLLAGSSTVPSLVVELEAVVQHPVAGMDLEEHLRTMIGAITRCGAGATGAGAGGGIGGGGSVATNTCGGCVCTKICGNGAG
ncbi:unnamed protein product [Strongylus vulgaris]|uniref:Uncharacterized protein n=1 Tax=Strongylus vulgaris TaxID=40348 RepID=A0A3P7IQP8_STRVU|nr:unnamed protein product [Strongylus vulgaris]